LKLRSSPLPASLRFRHLDQQLAEILALEQSDEGGGNPQFGRS
jgi:hypothetical protein